MGNEVFTDEKIDVHRAKRQYSNALKKFERECSILAQNHQYILKFLRACCLGQTVTNKQKKKIGEKRLLKYIGFLPKINFWLHNRDFKYISMEEMEDFIFRVENNSLELIKKGNITEVHYAEETRRDIKLCLRKFYKWLLGEATYFPKIVAWIDTHVQNKPPASLLLNELRRSVNFATCVRDKAMVWVLFETGPRAEEFLNIRYKEAEDKICGMMRRDLPRSYLIQAHGLVANN